MTSKDPFERVAAEVAGPRGEPGASPSQDAPVLVAPAPNGAPALPKGWGSLGSPAHAWTYRDAGGRVLRHTLRFPKAAEGEEGQSRDRWTAKDIRPCTLWRSAEGRLQWRLKGEPGLRPLYGLAELAARPSAVVLVVEGEKTADAARVLFPSLVVISWPGGAKATGKADWSPLAGRQVVAFPDADEPGRVAAEDLVRRAIGAGAADAVVAELPAGLPAGWDLADAWPAAFGQEAAEVALAAAMNAGRPLAVGWPYGFRMEADGLWYDQPTNSGGTAPTRLSEPFDVLGEARDPEGCGWAVVLRFKDRDGRAHTVPVLRSRLAGGSAEVRAELADAGLVISPAPGKAGRFAVALAEVRSSRRLTLVGATGWAGRRFVTPGRVMGAPGGEGIIYTGEGAALHYAQAGTLEGWRAEIAAKAVGNDLLLFALSLGLVGPLLRPLELEGGGVHFRGSSSSGKTTLAQAAGSIWGGGGPLGFGQTWRATANALEMVAHGHNDLLVVLDEIALVAAEEAGAAAYSLASGQSKARSRTDGSLRRRSEWRVAILSTGEISLADHIRTSKRGDRPMAGQELRLLDIAADGGRKMGVWETLHGAASPAALSDAVKAASGRHYGHAGPALVDGMLAGWESALAHAKGTLAGFLAAAARLGDTGQAARAASRFGAIAAAGELAVHLDVVPWPAGAAQAAALRLFQRWARSYGRDTRREDREVLQRLRGVISSERSAFSPLGDSDMVDDAAPTPGGRDGEARGLKTYGFRHVRGPVVSYLFHDEGWSHVFRGLNGLEAARIVAEAGFLEPADGGHLKRRTRVRGELQRLYWVRSAILDADFGDDLMLDATPAEPAQDGDAEERAAILEYDAGLSRGEAEAAARGREDP